MAALCAAFGAQALDELIEIAAALLRGRCGHDRKAGRAAIRLRMKFEPC
jgi:hypothetical protein